AAAAGRAFDQGRDLDPALDAEHRFLELEFEQVAKVRAAPRATTAPHAEDVREDVPEDVAYVGVEAAARAVSAFARRVAVPVVQRALVRIGEDFIGLLGFLEALLRVRIVGTAIGMAFHRHATERLLELGSGYAAFDAEDFVVAAFA